MARRSKPKGKLSWKVVALAVGLLVVGYVWPPFGALIDSVLGTDLFGDAAASRTEQTDLGYDDVDLAGLPDTPSSFSESKRRLYDEVYEGQRVTFYCGCDFDGDRDVRPRSCAYRTRNNAERAGRVEAEHVFPASQFGQQRACWREDLCERSDGSRFGGRSCCERIDPVFERAHNDLHNLVPAVGEVNGDRSNYNWGMIEGEARAYGACNFEVASALRRAEPPEDRMGDIARIYFYMADTYGLRLSDQDRQLYTAWSNLDPVDDGERERNERIYAIQGNRNPYIQ